MKIYDLIREDHDNIRDHMARLEDMTEMNAKSRRQVFRLLKDDLTQHMRIEEEVVYSGLEADTRFAERIGRSRREHGEIDMLIDQLERIDPSRPKWSERFADLKTAVERHLVDEETELFDRMHATLSEEQTFWMAETMNDRKARYRSAAA